MYKVVTELLVYPVRIENLINELVKDRYQVESMFPTGEGKIMIIASLVPKKKPAAPKAKKAKKAKKK